MARYVSWLANAVLLIICCAVVASTTNTVLAAWLTPEPAAVDPSVSSAPVATQRSWNDRQVILARNLFNASLLAPAQAAPVEEENLEETKLPLALLGTFASPDPRIARATVDDQDARMHLVLAVGDEITGGRAKLIRIERRRIVLEENGSLRELTFEDATPADSGKTARKPRRSSRKTASTRRRSTRKAEPAPTPSVADLGIRNPADIFSEARILPKWENGRMVGVQVSGIKSGSLFEDLGISNGEVITNLNGIAIDSPEASAQVMLELTEADVFDVTIDGEEGPRTVSVPINP
jgi:general secretion pathway protein C